MTSPVNPTPASCLVALAWVLGLLLPASPGLAGKLDQVRDATDGCSPRDPEDGDEDDEVGEPEPVGWTEHSGSGALPGRLPEVYFLPWPYAHGHRGRLFDFGALWRQFPDAVLQTPDGVVTFGQASAALAQEPELSSWSARIEAEYALDFARAHRPGLALTIDSTWGLGLSTRWTHYLEPTSSGELDQLGIGDVHVTYRVVEAPFLEVRLGLGARAMADDGATLGVSAMGALDAFPIEPLVLSAMIDLGNLGQAFYAHGRISLGVALDRVEPYLGYDAVWIAGPDAAVLFQGPSAGVRLWF
ncbi:MAG TPA: hypothetical protein P5076_19395 [Myxococcota bacterium]|nr:hypothetical protein [Myxococcota bacterium]